MHCKRDCISASNFLLASILKTTFIKHPRFRRSYWNIGNCEPSTLVIKTSSKRIERRDAINNKVTIVLKTITSKAIIQNHDDWYLFLYSAPPFPVDSWKCARIIKAKWIVSDHPRSSFLPSFPLVGAAECWQESGNKNSVVPVDSTGNLPYLGIWFPARLMREDLPQKVVSN